MEIVKLLLAGFFLPLFPLGMIFNLLFQRTRFAGLRAIMLLLWPLPGVWLVTSAIHVPDWLLLWALFSAVLYGFRAVVVKEFGVWIGFLATSAWALGWTVLGIDSQVQKLAVHVMAFSLPLALLVFLVAELERRYESAYAGIVSGVAQAQPRLSAMLVLVVLAVIGSPLFPAFFSMLSNITQAISIAPLVAVGLTFVWLLWSWSGVRLLQELLVGPAGAGRHKDMGTGIMLTYGLSLLILLSAGIYISGVLL